jgi:hypothetical protein
LLSSLRLASRLQLSASTSRTGEAQWAATTFYLRCHSECDRDPPRWLRLINWLVLDGIWAVVALVVLRSPRDQPGRSRETPN